MSIDMGILLPPVYENDEEAWELFYEAKDEQNGPAPAVFRELHDVLVEKSTLTSDQDSVWACGPLWNEFGNRLAHLAFISSDQTDEATFFLIDQSNALGIVAFDPQTGAVSRGKPR